MSRTENGAGVGPARTTASERRRRDPDTLPDDGLQGSDEPDSRSDNDLDEAASSLAEARERSDEQADFREQFDEDLFNDREDRPAQGNTADVAMEHRFGSEADAYAEYAWRGAGDHHEADGAAVGQSRDPADEGS